MYKSYILVFGLNYLRFLLILGSMLTLWSRDSCNHLHRYMVLFKCLSPIQSSGSLIKNTLKVLL